MPSAEAKTLLRAIEDFREAYPAGDSGDEVASVLEQLDSIEDGVRELVGGSDESPGQRHARESAEHANGREPEREPPPADEGESPKSFAEARDRARGRFGREEGGDGSRHADPPERSTSSKPSTPPDRSQSDPQRDRAPSKGTMTTSEARRRRKAAASRGAYA